jgi:hypothetical protein
VTTGLYETAIKLEPNDFAEGCGIVLAVWEFVKVGFTSYYMKSSNPIFYTDPRPVFFGWIRYNIQRVYGIQPWDYSS